MSVLDTLRQKARAWAQSVVTLHNTAVPPALEAEKQKLLSSAKTVKTAIEKVFGTIDELAPMAAIQNMGALPLAIPVVAISAASAAIAKWYYDHKKLISKVDSYNALTSGGLAPAQAIAVIDGKSGGILSSVKSFAIPIAVIAAGYLLLKNRA